MPKHLGRSLLPSQFNQGRDGIQGIEEEMRFHLHLQRTQVRSRELPLQLQRSYGLALRSNLQLDHRSEPENEPVHEEFQAKTIDAERAGPYRERACFRLPSRYAKADTATQEKMHHVERRCRQHMSGGGHRSQARHERHALTYLPKTAGDASPPSPKGQTIEQRRNMRDRVTLACRDQGKSECERKYNYVSIAPKLPAGGCGHGAGLLKRRRNQPGFDVGCSRIHGHPFLSPSGILGVRLPETVGIYGTSVALPRL